MKDKKAHKNKTQHNRHYAGSNPKSTKGSELQTDCHCEECRSTTKQSTLPKWIATLPTVARNDVKYLAFTLAEVLITLTIIGVIAAITIPNLVQSWRRHERITQIKTAYSIIQNATKMAVAEHGNPDGWDFSGSSGYAPKYFIPYVKVQKLCGVGTYAAGILGKGCFINNDKNGDWYTLNNVLYTSTSSAGYNSTYYYTMILQNGMHIAIWAPWSNPQDWAKYVYFYVDVDGKKGTSTLGKDIFTFRYSLDSGKFSTGGRPNNYTLTDCTLTGAGTACAYLIERNHWEFPDDYPVKKF